MRGGPAPNPRMRRVPAAPDGAGGPPSTGCRSVGPGEKANRPGSAAAEATAPAGAAQMGEPSTDGRPAGVTLRSTSHRPSCPKALAGDAALSARSPVARPVAVTMQSRCPGQVRGTAPAPRGPLLRRASLGWLADRHRPDHHVPPPGEPVGLPRWLGADSPCTDAADDDLAEAWVRTVLRRPPPEGDLSLQTRLPGPGRRCALRYGAHIAGPHHPRSRAISQFTGLSPELPRYPRSAGSSTVHAQVFPEWTGPSGCHAQRVRHVGGPRARLGVGLIDRRPVLSSHVISPNACALRRDHHHSVVHVALHVHVEAALRGGFFRSRDQ